MYCQIGTSEKHQKALLGGIERFIGFRGKDNPKFFDQTSAILAVLYQEDLVTEEVFKPWGTKASKKYVDVQTSKKVRKSAETFLKWLEEAESDDDSD